MSRDPDHPVLDRPWEYEIASFAYERDFDEPEQSTVVVGLRRGRDLVRLCFRGPRDLRMDPGFPAASLGLRILDTRARQLEGLGVQVCGFDDGGAGVSFWARTVERLEA